MDLHLLLASLELPPEVMRGRICVHSAHHFRFRLPRCSVSQPLTLSTSRSDWKNEALLKIMFCTKLYWYVVTPK